MRYPTCGGHSADSFVSQALRSSGKVLSGNYCERPTVFSDRPALQRARPRRPPCVQARVERRSSRFTATTTQQPNRTAR